MTKTETLLALAARVEAGKTGPEIDEIVFLYFGDEKLARMGWAFSTSLDVIAALTEKVLPGHRIEVSTYINTSVEILRWENGRFVHVSTAASITEPAARLAALLRALAEKEKEDD